MVNISYKITYSTFFKEKKLSTLKSNLKIKKFAILKSPFKNIEEKYEVFKCFSANSPYINIFYETEKIYTVKYKGVDIGFNRCDLIVEKCIVVELKAVSKVLFKETDKEVVQLKRYLKDLELENGVVINFPPASCSDDISYYIKL